MRIGFDAKRAFFNHSGLGNYSRNTIAMLEKEYPDNEYYLYTPSLPESIPSFAQNKTIITPKTTKKLYASIWRSVISGNKIRKDKIDVFHGLSNELPLNIKGTPSVVTIHDLIFMRNPELFKSNDVSIYKYKFQKACNNSNKIIAVSKQTKHDIIRYFKVPSKKIQVIYQDCNPAFQQQLSDVAIENIRNKYQLPKNYLLSVGTIERRKNVMLILKAMLMYDIKVPLLLVGKPTSYVNHIIAFAQKHGLKDYLITRYEVSNDDLPAIYQNASIFIYPSLFEGFGIPILEALNSGLPVITSNTSSMPEAGGSNSLYIDPVSHEQLGRVLLDLIDNKPKQESMRQAGFEHAKVFRDSFLAPQIMQLYNSL